MGLSGALVVCHQRHPYGSTGRVPKPVDDTLTNLFRKEVASEH